MCTSADFFLRLHVILGRMIKSALFKACSMVCYTLFPSFGQFVNTTPIKIFSFCCEPFLYIFVRTKALLSKCLKSSLQTNGNRKEPSLVNKQHLVELPSWVLPTYRPPVDDEVSNRALSWRNMNLCCLFRYSGIFFKQETIQIAQLLLVTFSMNCFSRF